MPSYRLTSTLPWYKRRANRWAYLSTLPPRKLISLYLAVFFIFSIFGSYQNLIHAQRFPIIAVLLMSVVNGAYSMLYPYLLIRRAVGYVVLTGFVHGFVSSASVGFAFLLNAKHPEWPRAGLTFTGNTIWISVVASYILFIYFIRSQAREAQRIQNELELAHGIQQTLVPPVSLSTASFEVYGISLPSDRVGGDLVDVVAIRGGTIAYIADVAGHGLQAGILMGMLKTAVHTILLDETTADAEALPHLLQRLDRVLPAVKESQMYATMAALQLGESGVVRYALAAHPAILHYHRSNGSISQLMLPQLPIGLLSAPPFLADQVQTAPGDLLVIATDGILEACNRQDEEFGSARLESLVTAHATEPLASLAARITAAVHLFGRQLDDQTLLMVRHIAGTSRPARPAP
jgi:serine phosphatase RsbU (regulator of sigma subunit)